MLYIPFRLRTRTSRIVARCSARVTAIRVAVECGVGGGGSLCKSEYIVGGPCGDGTLVHRQHQRLLQVVYWTFLSRTLSLFNVHLQHVQALVGDRYGEPL